MESGANYLRLRCQPYFVKQLLTPHERGAQVVRDLRGGVVGNLGRCCGFSSVTSCGCSLIEPFAAVGDGAYFIRLMYYPLSSLPDVDFWEVNEHPVRRHPRRPNIMAHRCTSVPRPSCHSREYLRYRYTWATNEPDRIGNTSFPPSFLPTTVFSGVLCRIVVLVPSTEEGSRTASSSTTCRICFRTSWCTFREE